MNVLIINAGSSSLKYQLMDPETGAVTVIDGAVTDEKGQATFTVTNGFTGYLTAVSNADNEDEEVYVLLNPTTKVKEIPVVTVDLTGLHSAQLASLKDVPGVRSRPLAVLIIN